MFRHPAHFIALGAGSGLAPVAPGTFGTLAAIPLALLLRAYFGSAEFVAAIVILFAAGAWAVAGDRTQSGPIRPRRRSSSTKLRRSCWCSIFVGADWVRVAVAFLVFRLFDIWKPPPIRQLDAAIKNGIGVMLDDLLAAAFTLVVFAVWQRALRMNDDSTFAGLDLRRVEEVGLNALQTQRQLFYDDWLLRVSPGKAKRARSVNAHFGSTLPLAQKIPYCERIYAERGLPTLFRITPFVQPPGLEAELAARGYRSFEHTLVQLTRLDHPPEAPAVPGVEFVVPSPAASPMRWANCSSRRPSNGPRYSNG